MAIEPQLVSFNPAYLIQQSGGRGTKPRPLVVVEMSSLVRFLKEVTKFIISTAAHF